MGFFSKQEAEAVEVAGRALKCLICSHDRFHKLEAVIKEAGISRRWCWCRCWVCDDCGFVHRFVHKSEFG